MTDFGREVRFGYGLLPAAAEPLVATAQSAEQLGYDYLAVQDHPYQRRWVDSLSLLAGIATATSRIGLLPDVACLPLRPPAMLARAATTIDILSGGRFELGLGSGGYLDMIEGYGGPHLTAGESVRALAEAIEVIRAVWSEGRTIDHDGHHYRLSGAQGGPLPPHPIGIWIGAYGPRSLRLVAQAADGWVPSFQGDVKPVVDMVARVDEAAGEAGRDPGTIRRLLNIAGAVTDGRSPEPFRWPVDQWVDQLVPLVVDHGFDTFVLWADDEEGARRLAAEAIPAVRGGVADARA